MGIIVQIGPVAQAIFNGVDTALFLTSTLVQIPVMVATLLLIVCQLGVCSDRQQSYNMKRIHNIIFKIAHHVYRFIPVDRSFEIPRFVMFGFVAPIYYSYHLLVFAVIIIVALLYEFWQTLFISSMIPCDHNNSTDDCVTMNIQLKPAINSTVTILASIVFVYTIGLELILKLSGGKMAYDDLFVTKLRSIKRLIRVILAFSTQLFFIFLKVFFVIYFIIVYFFGDVSNTVFLDHDGLFVTSLFIDVFFFVMLTPWFMFEKLTTEEFELIKELNEKHDEEDCEEETLFTRESQ